MYMAIGGSSSIGIIQVMDIFPPLIIMKFARILRESFQLEPMIVGRIRGPDTQPILMIDFLKKRTPVS